MTIADYKRRFRGYLHNNEQTSINISNLMHGGILRSSELNSILVYYGFYGEAAVCTGSMCKNCKFNNVENKSCIEVASDYVRKLIEDRTSLRLHFEDLL